MKIGVKIAMGFALGLVMIAALGVISYQTIVQQIESGRLVTETQEVLEHLERLMLLLTDAETGERGFIVTGRSSYLEPYNSAVSRIEHILASLASLTADNPSQQQSLRNVRKKIEARLSLLREGIEVRRKEGFQAAVMVVLTDRGKNAMDEIRGAINEMENRERLLLDSQTLEADENAKRTVRTILVAVPLSFLILGLAAFAITRHIARPLESIAFAARRISWGDLSVALPVLYRRDEVGVLRESFLLMTAWLRQMSDAARRIAGRDLTVSIVPQSDRDELGNSFSIMVENLRTMTGEIQRRSEALSAQNEELAKQSVELTSRNEKIQALNKELNSRGSLLQKLLDSARLSGTEEGVMQEVSKAAIDMFGQSATAAAVYEKVGGQLIIRGTAGIDGRSPEFESREAERTLADLAIRGNRTMFLTDTSLRPDLSILRVPGRGAFRSVLCAPIRSRGHTTGAFAIYGDGTQEWTTEQVRLAEWLAAQCAHSLETLRLQNDLRRQAELIDLSPDAILVRAEEGTTTLWGHGAESLYGWSREDVRGQDPHVLLKTRFPQSPGRIYGLLRETGHWSGELIQTTKDGREVVVQSRWLERRGKTIDGSTEILESNVDITERKQAEQALRDARDELEKRVRARTAELQRAYEELMEETREKEQLEDQLRQTQKMEAIGTLAGGVAHDFNNMLAAIIGNAELALEDIEGTPGPRRNIERILSASTRAAELVRQILTFSRKAEREKKVVNVAALVEETFKLLRGSLPSTIRMDLEIETQSDTILADPSQIQQVLVNLATNAAHAMREKGGSFTVSLTEVVFRPGDPFPDRTMAPGPYLRLTVRDTGTGMPPDVLKRIFEPFFTTKEVGEGAGMGLPVVYGIVKSHEGAITVESVPGTGTTFTVFLPRGLAGRAGEREEAEKGEGVPRGKERILVVDDEPLVVEMLAATLDRLGYEVTRAQSGSEALSEFLRKPEYFDLVLTDQTMPDITGMDLARRMLEARKDTPIILCTGYSEAVSEGAAKAAGIAEFIMKPVEKRHVAETIRRVLDTRQGS